MFILRNMLMSDKFQKQAQKLKSNLVKFLNKDLSKSFKLEMRKKIRRSYSRKKGRKINNFLFSILVLCILILGFTFGGFFAKDLYLWVKSLDIVQKLPFFSQSQQSSQSESSQPQPEASEYIPQTTQEEAIIRVVKEVSPAVVTIIITKDLPVFKKYYEDPFSDLPDFFDFPELKIPQYRQKGTEKKTIGGGTGFIVSKDGLILTNRHVVLDESANYTVITNDGEKYDAKVLAKDPFQDLAIIQIENEKTIDGQGEFFQESFSIVNLGNSDSLQIGQTVITIGNALGEFRNTVSVGVISGLGRTITASGGGLVETLEDVIQTDAAINKGNSGGPILNLKGEVIGVNVAMAETAQNIGFSIPINKAKRDIEQVKAIGKIVYPFLGVRYVLINSEIKEEQNLSVNKGALILKGDSGEPAVVADSVADKAGLQENDIILEVNNEEVSPQNSLSKIIREYQPQDKVSLKILRGDEEITINVILGEKTSEE